ncbi:SEFIR domain-containing protein [Bradyrhizobium erythrophlei]|uniref:SEFIR domain-containing protein n=1 Tax=Bradyrhizobium erythrophlei TaxID=1437360 RepID=A0A1M5KR32_9BRAD|nr:SEFIR domain-containing protein [Bradyrhizobium erythrophlei]SHG54623.1 SEFIR domain-containing protein [Bradyrhizobium erythrophlei]
MTPKAFISYSWTSPAHEQWVINLATQLVENGVDVILDKWDLREGNDAVQFMEAMVTNPEVTKVIIVSDNKYAEKANNRKGGVGTESQIMSPEIYRRADQSKFAAVVPEVDANGEPYLPAFLSSRIYIDMTESRYATNFEQLLRWLFEKPAYVKPALGKMPSFLDDEAPSPTRAKARRTIEALNTSSRTASASTTNYLDSLVRVLESFQVDPNHADFPQAVIDNIEAFLPYRNEFIEFMLAAAPASDTEIARSLQHFFERIIPLMSRPEAVSSWKDWDFDNYVFIVHELFLYAVAILLKHERFETLADFLDLRFYVSDERHHDEFMHNFSIVWKSMKALGPKQSELRRISLRGDFLEQRSHASGLKFVDVMAADFVLFLRSAILDANDYRAWYPETLLYAQRTRGPFEIFARAESRSYFERMAPVVAFKNKNVLEELIGTFSRDGKAGRWLPHWNYEVLNIAGLSNLSKLQTRP